MESADIELSGVTVTSMAVGGDGFARLATGKAAFIPRSAVGDTLTVKVVDDKKDYSRCEIVTIESPGAGRIDPPCQYWAECGGCQWMHISPEKQTEYKNEIIRGLFTRRGEAKTDPSIIRPLIPAPLTINHRDRVKLKTALYPGGKLKIGYFKRFTRQLVPITECTAAKPLVNEIIAGLSEYFDKNPPTVPLDNVDIETSPLDPHGRAILYFRANPDDRYITAMIESIPRLKGVTAYIGGRKKILHFGDTTLEYPNAPGIKLTAGPGVFTQVFAEQNTALVEFVATLVADAKETGIISDTRKQKERHALAVDAYCGIGNFSFAIAKKVPQGTMLDCIESARESVESANANKERLKTKNIQFIRGNTHWGLREIVKSGRKVKTILLDPPRGGLNPGTDYPALMELSPERIVYVSCDPACLERDILKLSADGYKLKLLQPFDMFPQTPHIETVAVMERS